MREIKFRGKRIIEPIKIERYAPDGWVYGDLLDCSDEMYILPTDISGEMYIDAPYRFRANDFETRVMVAQVDPESVGQFTGLYDKNGKEIYEGDILYQSFWGKLDDKTPIICKYCNGSICFTKQNFWDYGNNREREFGWNVRFNKKRIKKCEIVGNIYDNPELIKEINNV